MKESERRENAKKADELLARGEGYALLQDEPYATTPADSTQERLDEKERGELVGAMLKNYEIDFIHDVWVPQEGAVAWRCSAGNDSFLKRPFAAIHITLKGKRTHLIYMLLQYLRDSFYNGG